MDFWGHNPDNGRNIKEPVQTGREINDLMRNIAVGRSDNIVAPSFLSPDY